MGRVLTVSRASVTPEQRYEYLSAIASLAVVARDAGRHCWLFRDPADPGRYLEFREGPAGIAASSPAEQDLETRIRSLASHEGAATLWEEVTWPEEADSSGEPD